MAAAGATPPNSSAGDKQSVGAPVSRHCPPEMRASQLASAASGLARQLAREEGSAAQPLREHLKRLLQTAAWQQLGRGCAQQAAPRLPPPAHPAQQRRFAGSTTKGAPAAAATAAPAAAAAAAAAENEDAPQANLLRLMAAAMILGAAVQVAPHAAAQGVGHCLGLLDAREPFMQRAGVSRLQTVMRLEAAREKALRDGAVPKLLRLVQQPEADPVVVAGALEAITTLSETEAGMEAVQQAGAEAVLQSYLSGTAKAPATEDAVYRAAQLLAAVQKAPWVP